MDWYDGDDILIGGTKTQIASLRCPDCGGRLKYAYSGGADAGRLAVSCIKCYALEVLHKLPEPNCARFFGKNATVCSGITGGDET